MKMSKNILPFLLLPCLLLIGCSKDKPVQPPVASDNLILHFSYDNFPDYINRVNVSVFDASGVVVENKELEKNALLNSANAAFSLSDGIYTVVCWGNAFENTRINIASLSESRVSHPNYNTDALMSTSDSLYFGRVDGVAVMEGLKIEETVNFVPAHITINMTVDGLADATLRLRNLNELYDFNQDAISPIESTFYPVCITSGNVTTATTNVYRFTNDTPIVVDVLSGEDVLTSVALSEYLHSHPSLVIEDGKEFTFDLIIGFATDHNITIEVNGWDVVPTTAVF